MKPQKQKLAVRIVCLAIAAAMVLGLFSSLLLSFAA